MNIKWFWTLILKSSKYNCACCVYAPGWCRVYKLNCVHEGCMVHYVMIDTLKYNFTLSVDIEVELKLTNGTKHTLREFPFSIMHKKIYITL